MGTGVLMGVRNSKSAGSMGMGRCLKGPTADGQDAATDTSEQQGCLLATGEWFLGHQGYETEGKGPLSHCAIVLPILVPRWENQQHLAWVAHV